MTGNESNFSKQRIACCIILLIIIPLGFYTKFYRGPFQGWIYLYAGDILYPMFFFFLVLLFFPKLNPFILASANFAFDTAIEFTQLSKAPFLTKIRENFIGRTIIGEGFEDKDIFYYLLGNLLALGIYFLLFKITKNTRK